MSRGTMLYIRVPHTVLEDLMKVTHSRDLLQNKSSLAIICEDLLEWAASYAAHGEAAEELIEQRQRQYEYGQHARRRKDLTSPDALERIMDDASRTKEQVLDNVAKYIAERKERNA